MIQNFLGEGVDSQSRHTRRHLLRKVTIPPAPLEAVWEWGDHSITTPQPSHTIRGCEASDTVLNIVTKGNLEGKGFALSYIFIIEEN